MWDFDTRDLNSYYDGYNKEYKETIVPEKDIDGINEDMEINNERNIIDIRITEMKLIDSLLLSNYIWKGNYLIPDD